MPSTRFYAQHIIDVVGDDELKQVQAQSVIRATKLSSLKDLTLTTQLVESQWKIEYRAKGGLFMSGCATARLTLKIPSGLDALSIHVPVNAKVNVRNVRATRLNIVHGNVRRPLPPPRRMGEDEVAPASKGHHHQWKRWFGRHHRKLMHHGGRRGHGKRPGCKKPQVSPTAELYAPKVVNVTDSSFTELQINSTQSVHVRYVNCADVPQSRILIGAENLNLSKSSCNLMGFGVPGLLVRDVTGSVLNVDYNGFSRMNATFSSVLVKNVNVKSRWGKIVYNLVEKTLVNARVENGKEVTMDAPDLEYLTNSERIKIAKWRCSGDCVNDVKLVLNRDSQIQVFGK
jgi:hypothetical protein